MLNVETTVQSPLQYCKSLVQKDTLTKLETQYLEDFIWQLRVQKMKNSQMIADLLGCKVKYVQKIVNKTLTKTIDRTELSGRQEIEQQIQMLETMLSETWDAWLESKGAKSTITERGTGTGSVIDDTLSEMEQALQIEEQIDEQLTESNEVKITRVTRHMHGDPRYMAEMRNILTDLRRLKGINETPKQHIFMGPNGGAIEMQIDATPALDKMDGLIGLLISQGVLPQVGQQSHNMLDITPQADPLVMPLLVAALGEENESADSTEQSVESNEYDG